MMNLIPGRKRGTGDVAMKWTMVAASGVGALGLGGLLAGPVAAQSRLIVPIVIQVPRTAAQPGAQPPSVIITTRTGSAPSGVSTTQITVQDATGAVRDASAPPRAGSGRPGVSTTQITVQDTTGAVRDASNASRGVSAIGRTQASSPSLGASSTQITVQSTTGGLLGPRGTPRTGASRPGSGTTEIRVEDTTGAVHDVRSPFTSFRDQTGISGQQTFVITSEAPIDAPIVILAQ